MNAEQLWVLQQLDIDVWVPAGEVAPAAGKAPAADTAPAAEALALLRGARSQATPTPRTASEPAASAPEHLNPNPAPAAPAPQLDLWCLSVPGVLLLTDRVGLDTQSQRFLRDLIRAVSGRYKVAPRQANFRWPQPEIGDLPVAGALRGLTQRLLGESAENADAQLLLLGNAAQGLELPFTDAQTWQLGVVTELMASASAKRELWQRVQKR